MIKRVVVTGATGGLGRSLTEFLIEKGIEVVALGRNAKVGEELCNTGVIFHSGNIDDFDYVKSAMAGADAVVHCAGLASPFGKWEDFYASNVRGTEVVLRAMRELGVSKLIYISTPSLYFSGGHRLNISEDSPLPEPTNFYARSKGMADELVLQAVKEWDLNALLLRPRAIIGKYDTTIVPRLLRIMRKGFFPLPDGGSALIDLTAVENVVHAIWLGLNHEGKLNGEVLNISNGEPTSVRELTQSMVEIFNLRVRFVTIPSWILLAIARIFETIAALRGQSEPMLSRYSVQSIATTQTLSIEKAKSLIGYEPIVSLRDALAKIASS